MSKSVRLRSGERLTYEFTVRLGAAAGAGSVQVALPWAEPGTLIDRDAGNNSAPIAVRPVGPAPDDGGGLPVTGPAAAAVAIGGVLLVLLGIGVIVPLRRRRARAG